MSIATITSKGQVTLPKDIRVKLHLETGAHIDFRVDEESGTAMLIPINKRVDEVFGVLGGRRRKRVCTPEEMDRGVAAHFKREYR